MEFRSIGLVGTLAFAMTPTISGAQTLPPSTYLAHIVQDATVEAAMGCPLIATTSTTPQKCLASVHYDTTDSLGNREYAAGANAVYITATPASASRVMADQKLGLQYVEHGFYAHIHGVYTDPSQEATVGMGIFDWAQYQQCLVNTLPSYGMYPSKNYTCTNTVNYDVEDDLLLGTAFLVEAQANSLTMIRQFNNYTPTSCTPSACVVPNPDGSNLTSQIQASALLAAQTIANLNSTYPIDSTNLPMIQNYAQYTHRMWVLAGALGAAGEVAKVAGLPYTSLRDQAYIYVYNGLDMQWSAATVPAVLPSMYGVNPELGGYDVGYQTTGLEYAERYYLTLTTSATDTALKPRIIAMLTAGLDWEASRINPDGSMNWQYSTRICKEQGEKGTKGVPYVQIATAFAIGALVTGNSAYANDANEIIAGQAYQDYVNNAPNPAGQCTS